MHTIYLALGANVGDKKQHIARAIELLEGKVTNIVLAPIYETKPWGYEAQENFLNTALKGMTELSPHELLLFVKNIEKEVGRIKRFRNGPREIDIDILFYDKKVIKDNILQIPHLKIQERDFVLQPLVDIAPNFIHPEFKMPLHQLFKNLPLRKIKKDL